jgi:hypothetical protein
MSVAVERRTVSLWVVDESPLRSGPRRPVKAPAADALAAITSSYRRGRAGIIAGASSQEEASPPTHFPTVPVPFVPRPTVFLPAVPGDRSRETTTFWSRLVRTRRGRHAPKS